MRNILACLVVNDPKLFNWLGEQTLLAAALSRLKEVRGISRIVCVASQRLFQQTKDVFADTVVATVCELDADVLCLVNWLTLEDRPGKGMDAVILIQPAFPCLPAAKIEACLHALRGDKADHAATVMAMPAVSALANTDKVLVMAGGCQAVRTTMAQKAQRGRFKAVPVSLLEGLDIRDHDQYRLVTALEQTGQL